MSITITKANHFDNPSTLMLKTQELLNATDLFKIHRDTLIPYYWLNSFRQNKFKNPSVNRVVFLYEHLTGKKLKI